jgi:hypothetical protein
MVATKKRAMKRRQKPFLLALLDALTVMTVTAVRAQPMADPAETDFQAKTTGGLVRRPLNRTTAHYSNITVII